MHSHRWLRNEKLAVGWFFVAGAVPGLLLLAAEGLTRLGGAALVKLVTNADAAVIAPIESTDATRLRHGLIVLVVGGVGAAIAGARTRRAQRLEDERMVVRKEKANWPQAEVPPRPQFRLSPDE